MNFLRTKPSLNFLKHKYSEGIEFIVRGNRTVGYFLYARCLKRKKWAKIAHKKIKGHKSTAECMVHLEMLNKMDFLMKSLEQCGVKTFHKK